MSGTVVGLLGVLFGALLGGVVALRGDRRNRRIRAIVATKLIAGELTQAASQMRRAVDDKSWWRGALPTSRWRDLATDLGFDIDDDTTAKVGAIYSVMDKWNAAAGFPAAGSPSARATSMRAPSAQDLQMLDGDADSALTVVTKLNDERKRLHDLRLRERLAIRGSIGTLALAVIVVSLITTFEQRPHLTNSSVADSIAQGLGTGHVVTCTTATDDWTCSIYSTTACTAVHVESFARPHASNSAPAEDVDLQQPTTTTCAQRAPPEHVDAVPDGGQIVVVPHPPASKRDPLQAILEEPTPTEDLWDRFKAKVAGSD